MAKRKYQQQTLGWFVEGWQEDLRHPDGGSVRSLSRTFSSIEAANQFAAIARRGPRPETVQVRTRMGADKIEKEKVKQVEVA